MNVSAERVNDNFFSRRLKFKTHLGCWSCDIEQRGDYKRKRYHIVIYIDYICRCCCWFIDIVCECIIEFDDECEHSCGWRRCCCCCCIERRRLVIVVVVVYKKINHRYLNQSWILGSVESSQIENVTTGAITAAIVARRSRRIRHQTTQHSRQGTLLLSIDLWFVFRFSDFWFSGMVGDIGVQRYLSTCATISSNQTKLQTFFKKIFFYCF